MDGILNINKPRGITSMDIVRRMKRAADMRRVGHGGTLDPIATGVVPVFFGQATRTMEYVVDGAKEYRGTIELGVSTDTYDAEGEVTETREVGSMAMEDIEKALKAFRGTIDQVPPMYSAIKQRGKRLYTLARAGIEVEREPRSVVVHSLSLERWEPPEATVLIECGRGFYMRSLAHDLGQQLGVGGHLKELMRLSSGNFDIRDSVTLEEAEQRFEEGSIGDVMAAPDAALSKLNAMVIGRRPEAAIRNGRSLPTTERLPAARPGDLCRAYSVDGRFLAILTFDGNEAQWRPHKVFSLGAPEDTE